MSKRRWFASFVLMLLFALGTTSSSQALPEKKIIEILDAESGKYIEKVTAHITLTNLENEEKIVEILFSDKGTLTLPLQATEYTGHIILDDALTDAVDYYFSGTIFFENNRATVAMIPIAQIDGRVVDLLENLIGDATLVFACDKLNTINFPERTSKQQL